MKSDRIKTLALLSASLFTMNILLSCDDEEQNSKDNYSCQVLKLTDCHYGVMNEDGDTTERLEYELNGHDLIISLYNQPYNCCDSELKIAVQTKNDTIFITETFKYACDCLCIRDAQYKISNIPKGHYTVELGEDYRTFDINVE